MTGKSVKFDDTGMADVEMKAAGSQDPAEESEDEVVLDVPVYMNHLNHEESAFVGQLYLLQYPLRPNYRPYGDQGNLKGVQMRPSQRKLRIAYDLCEGENFDEGAVENKLNTQWLQTSVVDNPSTSYCVGVFHNNQMILSPITSVNQLRPDFTHIDENRGEQNASGATASKGDEEIGGEKSGAEKKKMEVVGVKFQVKSKSKKQTERAEEKRKIELERDMEWMQVEHYDQDSVESSDVYFEHLLGVNSQDPDNAPRDVAWRNRAVTFQNTSAESYLSALSGGATPQIEKDASAGGKTSAPVSQFTLARMPVDQQVELLIKHSVVANYFKHIKARLPPASRALPDEELIKHLENFADCVHGNWVLKSEHAGYEGKDFYVRDLILMLLDGKTDNTYIDLQKIVAGTKTARENVYDMVKQFCVQMDDKGERWRLKLEPDKVFIEKFPEIRLRHSERWASRKTEVVESIKKEGDKDIAELDNSGMNSQLKAKIKLEVRALLQEGSKSIAFLKRELQKHSSTHTITDADLENILPSIGAISIRGVWIMAETGDKNFDDHRRILISLCRRFESVTKAEVQQEIANNLGKCKLTDFALRKLIKEFADNKSGRWIFRGNDRCKECRAPRPSGGGRGRDRYDDRDDRRRRSRSYSRNRSYDRYDRRDRSYDRHDRRRDRSYDRYDRRRDRSYDRRGRYRSRSPYGRGGKGKGKGQRCFNCGEQGHIGRECPHKEVVCFNCNGHGHLSRDCPDPDRRETVRAGGRD